MIFSMESKLIQLPRLLLLAISFSLFCADAKPLVPCYFVFGDSLSDNGNNNNLHTLAKVSYPPYGIDFPGNGLGRFSNGRNVHDFIVKFLGLEDYIPPFAALSKEEDILKGVNYASGSAGILHESGRQLGTRIPLDMQIRNHKTIISRITKILRNESSTEKLLNQCIYSINIGSNDYINNYFKSQPYNTSRNYTPDQFATMLVQQLSEHIKNLYGHGARKFALYGLGLLGCSPIAIDVYGTNGSLCVDNINNAISLFNNRLSSLVNQLNGKLTDAKFTYLYPAPDPVDILTKFVIDSSCCKIGGGGGELCIPNSMPCDDRNKYLFWDGVHPTEAFNEILAKNAYGTVSPFQAFPFNIHNLAK